MARQNQKFKVQTTDGEVLEGDADEIVQAMADSKMAPVKSIKGYRRATARRIKELFNEEIDPTNSETFVRSMIAGNLLTDLTA